MKNEHGNGNNYVDALDRENGYAVLTKKGRVQVLIHPTAKQLRKRGKRGWQLFQTIDIAAASEPTLMEIIQEAIAALEGASKERGGKKKRQHAVKAAAQ
jgi:hypothetical protein